MKTKNQHIIDLFNQRFTCKKYDKDKIVLKEDFETIIEVARLSPSSFGYEPWKFILLNNQKIKDQIRPYSWGGHAALDGASHFVLILARTAPDMQPDSKYIEHIHNNVQNYPKDMVAGRQKRYGDFLDKDFKINESARSVFDWTSKQAYIPLTSMMLTAAALGIDSTPIEGFNQDEVHKILVSNGVYDPNHFKVAVMVSFGYGEPAKRFKMRQTLNEVFTEIN
ncbi:MAG: NAD(P)H-dependent oxidoreductase [Erysipelothrix sp.]|nr:NAD(P)H-dependent oxidoreductase [Erysipelothrix sp.]